MQLYVGDICEAFELPMKSSRSALMLTFEDMALVTIGAMVAEPIL